MLRKFSIVGVIFGFALVGFGAGSLRAQNSSAQNAAPTAPSAQTKGSASAAANYKADIPAYHAEVPKVPLPATLDPTQFTDAETRNVYTLAAEEKDFLYQQPCYCRCDKEVGHKSLLDCFHGLSRRALHSLQEGSCFYLYGVPTGKNGCTDPQGNHERQMEGRRPVQV